MVCKSRDIYGLLSTSWVLITYIICPPVNGVDSNQDLRCNQDLIWCVEIGVYMGFWVHAGS